MITLGTSGTYGTGATYGAPTEEYFGVEDAVLSQHPHEDGARDFRDLVLLLCEESVHFRQVCAAIIARRMIATAGDVDLDWWGALLGLPRSGLAFLRYRAVLGVFADFVIANEAGVSAGSIDNVLAAVRTLVGPGAPPIRLRNLPPYDFELRANGVLMSERHVFAQLVQTMLDAGVAGTFGVAETFDVYGSVHGAVPNVGTYGSVHGTVSGAARYGHTFLAEV